MCDNVGNCSASGEQLALPLRLGSSSAVSFHKIVNPAQPRLVRQRVRVGWHWAKVRRHGHLVRVKRGGHYKQIKVWKVVLHCSTKRVRVTRHRWRIHRTCTLPKLHLKRVARVRFGHKAKVHGLLMTAQGIPLGGVAVQILTAPTNGFDQFTQTAVVTTDALGRWSATLPPGPSRKIEAIYNGAPTVLPAAATARVVVRAKVKLNSITPNRLPWNDTVRISGRVFGGWCTDSVPIRALPPIRNPPRATIGGMSDIQPIIHRDQLAAVIIGDRAVIPDSLPEREHRH